MALWLKKEWMGDGKLLKHQNIPDCIVETKQVNMWGGVCQRARSYEMYRCLLGLYLLNSELKKKAYKSIVHSAHLFKKSKWIEVIVLIESY